MPPGQLPPKRSTPNRCLAKARKIQTVEWDASLLAGVLAANLGPLAQSRVMGRVWPNFPAFSPKPCPAGFSPPECILPPARAHKKALLNGRVLMSRYPMSNHRGHLGEHCGPAGLRPRNMPPKLGKEPRQGENISVPLAHPAANRRGSPCDAPIGSLPPPAAATPRENIGPSARPWQPASRCSNMTRSK